MEVKVLRLCLYAWAWLGLMGLLVEIPGLRPEPPREGK